MVYGSIVVSRVTARTECDVLSGGRHDVVPTTRTGKVVVVCVYRGVALLVSGMF